MRALAWGVLGLLALVYAWLLDDLFQLTGLLYADWDNVVWPLVVFLFLLWLLYPAPLWGVWLLGRAVQVGGGRLAWRWIVGALLLALLMPTVLALPHPLAEPVPLNGRSWLEFTLLVLAIGPVWVLARRRS